MFTSIGKESYWRNQVILITGSSRGLGREMAIHFSSLGARVAINYHNNLEAAEEVLRQMKGPAKIYKADVGDETQIKEMIKKIQEDLGYVTVLINNAGITRDNIVLSMDSEDWRSVIRTNLDGPFYTSKACLEGMLNQKHGRIINVSSISGIQGNRGQANYAASKSGLLGLTKTLAREMGKKKITCNLVNLGPFETEMMKDAGKEVLDFFKKQTSVKRIGQSKEVLGLMEYLAGPESAFLTGQQITLDGGIV